MNPPSPSDHPHESSSKASVWHLVSMVLGIGFALAAFLLGASFVIGGIRAASEKPLSLPGTAPSGSGGTGPSSPTALNPSGTPSMANGVASVAIKPGSVNPMSYDTASFTVKSGQTVKVTLNNDSMVPLQHNLCICKPGSKDAMMAEAAKMMTDPNGLAKGFIPETPDILWHTKLLNPKESQTLEFVAPAPGEYPYMCTFPGHSIIMNGVMRVE